MPFGFNYRNVMKEPHKRSGAGRKEKIKEVVTWRFVECRKRYKGDTSAASLFFFWSFVMTPKLRCFMRLMHSLFSYLYVEKHIRISHESFHEKDTALVHGIERQHHGNESLMPRKSPQMKDYECAIPLC